MTVDFDEAHPERSTVEAHLDASSIDTGIEARDTHLRSADFLDAAVFPELVFKSTGIEHSGDGYKIAGDLTMHGEMLPVTLETELGGIVADMQGGRRAGFSASAKISRKSWGLTWNGALEAGGVLVGDDIKITMDVALVQAAPSAVAAGAGVA
jgi:polyisoprenoid-binding protein YceI